MKPQRFFRVLCVLILGSAAAVRAQTVPPVAAAPDVLVLVFQRPGLGDEVNMTYNRLVPHTQVQQDLAALQNASGWTLTGLKVTDARAPMQRLHNLSSATFAAPGVVRNEAHTLPVEVFTSAFRGYKNLALIFVTDSSFQFQGLREYADNNVRITLDQHGAAYTYHVTILNPQFNRLNLPSSAQAAHLAEASRARRPSPLLLLIGLVGTAAAVGVLVYAVTCRLSTKN